jgi:hypothetical protein
MGFLENIESEIRIIDMQELSWLVCIGSQKAQTIKRLTRRYEAPLPAVASAINERGVKEKNQKTD